jgi:prepilin-type N-terminal cleavage/methylation domain-containing protein
MKKNQRGDTLIEVLIAITVLGIIVAGVMATMNHSLVSILNSAERTATRTDINTETDLLNYVHNNDKETWERILSVAYIGTTSGGKPDAPAENIRKNCTLNENSEAASNKPGSFYLQPMFDSSGSVEKVVFRDKLTEAGDGKNEFQRATIGDGNNTTQSSQGIWIDAVYFKQGATVHKPYVDFYIKACWVPFGGGTSPNANTQSITITRIHDYENDDSSDAGGGVVVPPVSSVVASVPTITASNSVTSNTVTFSWSSTCAPASGTTKSYQYRTKTNSSGAWSGWQTTTSSSTTMPTSLGNDYYIEVKTKCSTSDTEVFSASVIKSISRPSSSTGGTLIVSHDSGTPTKFSWSGATCAKGTLQYRYRAKAWGGSYDGTWSSWYTISSTSYSLNTNTSSQGYDYSVEVQARCTVMTGTTVTDYGNWSGSKSATYTRAIATPSTASAWSWTTVTENGSLVARANWTAPTCGTGTRDEYSYTASWDNGANYGVWSDRGWFTATARLYASSGNKVRVKVRYTCVNVTTGRASAVGDEATSSSYTVP